MRLIDYANPTRFLGLTATVLPWLAAVTALTFAVGLYLVFFVAPADYQQEIGRASCRERVS
jgi:heme exporter protein C